MVEFIISIGIFTGLFIAMFFIHDRKNFNRDSLSLTIIKFILLLLILASFVCSIVFLFSWLI